mgnify:CR=1 FL=1
MSIDSKEVIRITRLQVNKKCANCKTGKYINTGLILCDNCGTEPFKKY